MGSQLRDNSACLIVVMKKKRRMKKIQCYQNMLCAIRQLSR
jgi:hypothetical protein